MPVKNPTLWSAPSGAGYFSSSGSENLLTLSGAILKTNSGVNLILAPETYAPKSHTLWTVSTKTPTDWNPTSGQGYTETVGTEDLATNSGFTLTDNKGNNIVTNPTVVVGKSLTTWTQSGT